MDSKIVFTEDELEIGRRKKNNNLLKIDDLIQSYPHGKIPYGKLLKTKNWIEKRKKIVKRDNEICQHCKVKGVDLWQENIIDIIKKKDTYFVIRENQKTIETCNLNKSLHVHHKLYYYDPLTRHHVYPWLYKDEELITLCSKCHMQEHERNIIPTLHKDTLNNILLTACHRCFGWGIFYEFLHYKNGVCFRCGGAKYEELIMPAEIKITAEKLKKYENEWNEKFSYGVDFLVNSNDKESRDYYCQDRIDGISKQKAFLYVIDKEFSDFLGNFKIDDNKRESLRKKFQSNRLSGFPIQHCLTSYDFIKIENIETNYEPVTNKDEAAETLKGFFYLAIIALIIAYIATLMGY